MQEGQILEGRQARHFYFHLHNSNVTVWQRHVTQSKKEPGWVHFEPIRWKFIYHLLKKSYQRSAYIFIRLLCTTFSIESTPYYGAFGYFSGIFPVVFGKNYISPDQSDSIDYGFLTIDLLTLGEIQSLSECHGPPTLASQESCSFDQGRSLVDK